MLNPDAFKSLPAIGLKEVVFGVYAKCRQNFQRQDLTRLHAPSTIPSASIGNLPYAIASNRPRQAMFSASKRISLPVRHAVDADRVMHIAIQSNSNWLCAAWCDQNGEMVDIGAFRRSGDIRNCIREVLEKTLILTGRGGLWWRLVFGFGSPLDVKNDLDRKCCLSFMLE